MQLESAGPAIIRVRKKSRTNPTAEGRVINAALLAARGHPFPLPVVFEGTIIGYAQGRGYLSDEVAYAPAPVGFLRYECAFSTYDALIAALTAGQKRTMQWAKAATSAVVANNWYDLWPVGGNPTSGAYGGAAKTAVQKDDTTVGSIAHGGNVSPNTKHIITCCGYATGSGLQTLMLVDRVLTYEACPYAAAVNQTMTNGVAALRYVSSGQSGLQMAWTAQTVHNATAANITQLRYTNQAGATLQLMPTATNVAIIISAAAPTATLGARINSPATTAATLTWGAFMPLAAGDTGVRLVNDYTPSAANTGTVCLALVKPLFYVPLAAAGVVSQVDGVMQIPNLEQVFDGACLNWFSFHPATTAATIGGMTDVAWG